MRLSDRAKAITPSPTLAVEAKARAMRESGVDIIGFGAGEPDFDTPKHIADAGVAAIKEGHTRYTAVSGTPELKKAVVETYKKVYGLTYEPAQVIVSVGAKHCLYNAFQALCQDGDEVIIPAPYWVSYPDQVMMAGAKPVILDTTKTGFKMTADGLSQAITEKTVAVVLNSPSNPTGAVYDRNELKAIAQVIIDNDLFLISDDIYERLLYTDKEYVCIAALGEEIKARTLVVNGVSKTYAMTGWRIGYALGPKELVNAMGNIQGHSTSNPCSISMRASVAALTGPDEPIKEMVRQFRARGEYMAERLAAMPGVECQRPAGAFYCFPKVSALYGKTLGGIAIKDSLTFADAMLSEAHIAVVSGAGFGADEYVRLSYATSIEKIREGLDRMERAIASMK